MNPEEASRGPVGGAPGPGRDRAEYWLDVVADLYRRPLRALPHDRIAADLTRSLAAVGTADHRRSAAGVVQRIVSPGIDPERWREINELAPTRATDVPLLRWYLLTGETRAQHTGGVPDALSPGWRHTRWLAIGRPLGVDQQLAIPLENSAHRHHSFVVARGEPYTADDVAFARRVQALLWGLVRQAAALARSVPDAPSPASSTPEGATATGTVSGPLVAEVGLTPREIAVLGVVAQGATAETAARELAISPRTVHKHLEHAYAKLGVRDRVSAILRARDLGLTHDPVPNPS